MVPTTTSAAERFDRKEADAVDEPCEEATGELAAAKPLSPLGSAGRPQATT